MCGTQQCFVLAGMLQIKREMDPYRMCSFWEFISSLVMFFILWAMVSLGFRVHETTHGFGFGFSFLLGF